MREKTDNLRDRFPLGGGTSEIGRSWVYQGGVHCLEVLEQKNGEIFEDGLEEWCISGGSTHNTKVPGLTISSHV